MTTDWDEVVSGALDKSASKVRRVGSGWRFTVGSGRRLRGSATATDGWLLMTASLNGLGSKLSAPEHLWALLSRNAHLAAGAKTVLDGRGSAALQAEIPLGEDVPVSRRIREVWGAFSGVPRPSAEGEPPIGRCATNGAFDLKDVCSQIGWTFAERSPGRLTVDLDTQGGLHQATLECDPDDAVSVVTQLASWGRDSLGDRSRQAIAVLLLEASRTLRMGRALAESEDCRDTVGFGVSFASSPCAVEVAHALSSLSVACRLCGREVMALGDETLAAEYLAIRAWTS